MIDLDTRPAPAIAPARVTQWRNRFTTKFVLLCSRCGNQVGVGEFLDCAVWPSAEVAEERAAEELELKSGFIWGCWIEAVPA